MSYSSFDPRVAIREQIGTERYVNGDDVYTITVKDKYDDNVYIPLLLPGEIRTGVLNPMPFIEMTLVTVGAEAHNVGGDVRYTTAYIDFNVYYSNTDNINPTLFGKKVADCVVNLVTNNRQSVTGSYFMEVINDGREILETDDDGKIIAFHRVVEVKINNYS